MSTHSEIMDPLLHTVFVCVVGCNGWCRKRSGVHIPCLKRTFEQILPTSGLPSLITYNVYYFVSGGSGLKSRPLQFHKTTMDKLCLSHQAV